MPGDGKRSALAEIARDLGERSAHAGASRGETGTGAAHTPAASESFAEGDLFRDLDEEVDQFAGAAIAPPAKRGPGQRGPSRTTKQLQRFLRQRGYRDPAEFLAALVSMDLGKMASEIGAERIEALKVQVAAARELMPYFHQKMPLQVEQTGDGARPLILMFEGPTGGRASAGAAGAMSVHDQGVIDGVAVEPHAREPHAKTQATDMAGTSENGPDD